MKSMLLEVTIEAHKRLINLYGGSHGVRDQGALEAAINRPYMTFDQKDLYPQSVDKAAAIMESLLINHPFIDGNKRIGYFMAELLLEYDDLHLPVSEKEKYDFTINVAEGKLNIDQITDWIRVHTIEMDD